jgi:hypothetical protein
MPTRIEIEPAVELPSGLPGSRFRVHGRLILTGSALYFIHGWDEQVRDDLWWIVERTVRPPKAEQQAAHVGREMLARYADRSPEQQAEIVPGSRVLPLDDLSSATQLRWPARLRIETRRRGDTLVYRIPRAMGPAVSQWIAERAR